MPWFFVHDGYFVHHWVNFILHYFSENFRQKPFIQVQNRHYKLLDWKWTPPFWNFSENSSDLVALPVPHKEIKLSVLCLVLIFQCDAHSAFFALLMDARIWASWGTTETECLDMATSDRPYPTNLVLYPTPKLPSLFLLAHRFHFLCLPNSQSSNPFQVKATNEERVIETEVWFDFSAFQLVRNLLVLTSFQKLPLPLNSS